MLAVCDASSVQRPTKDVVANTMEGLFTPAPRIKTMECSCRLWPDTGDVGCDFNPIGQDAHVQLCEGPNSASLASTCTRACTRLSLRTFLQSRTTPSIFRF
jgi:hypothetical protein